MHEQSKNFNRDRKHKKVPKITEHKKSQNENTVTELENSTKRFNNRLDPREERIRGPKG